ncbi:YfhO family protein [Flavobacteriaceae bacterium LSUCC0859]|nr:YfhO family protein [Flavobacteriaceae bacterium LSUCC0859]
MKIFPRMVKQTLVLSFFALVALVYFYPVLQNKQIEQSDIVQYTGMAKEQNDFRAETNSEPYWTNGAFGGMPTYQLGAQFPHNYIKKLDRLIRFLPRPADYLFLYFIGFYILLCSLKLDYKIAIIGALAYGLSTYFIIILGVGHNAKAHALGYMPIVLAGIIWVFDKKYLLGFLVTALGMALEIVANHVQMTYYFMFLVLILGAVYGVYALREKTFISFVKGVGILLVAVILGMATNATMLLSTKEYASWSTRGPSELSIQPDGSPKEQLSGLDSDYITHYSYGPLESFNLLVPRLSGGSISEAIGEGATYDFLTSQGVPHNQALEFSNQLPLYWGPQPPTSGPAYLGAIILALCFLGFLSYKEKIKWVFLLTAIFTLMLSWGKFFMPLTTFMIDYFPLYDKFRAVSSIQVMVAFSVMAMAALGLSAWLKSSEAFRLKTIKTTALFFGGLLSLLYLISFILEYSGQSDASFAAAYGDAFVDALKLDRARVYKSDVLRSLGLIALLLGLFWWAVKKSWSSTRVLLGVGLLVLLDLFPVAKRYVNSGDFVTSKQVQQPFVASAIDKEILKDTTYFRVYDMAEGVNGARTSYFHQSLGGYHAAKPATLNNLFDFHVYQSNLEVLHMFNVKYVIQQDENGSPTLAINPRANGPAWFVSSLVGVPDPDSWILGLHNLDTKNTASVLLPTLKNELQTSYEVEKTASISLVFHAPNKLVYRSSNANTGFAVFSEMYYKHGWQAKVDGTDTPIYRVDYTLRGLELPAGDHEIIFEFKPDVVKYGSQISLAASSVLFLIIGLFLGRCMISTSYFNKLFNGKRSS